MISYSRGVASMEDLQSLVYELRRGLSAGQKLQQVYDHDMWDIDDPSYEKIRHIHIHLSISVGKLAKLIEPADHKYHHGEGISESEIVAEMEPILADLLMHCLQLANLGDNTLADMFLARYRQNATRFAPESTLSQIE